MQVKIRLASSKLFNPLLFMTDQIAKDQELCYRHLKKLALGMKVSQAMMLRDPYLLAVLVVLSWSRTPLIRSLKAFQQVIQASLL